MSGTSRVAFGFMKYYLRLQQAVSTVFGFYFQSETSAPMLPTPLGWNSSISSRQAKVVGYFYEMWVFVLWLCWLILRALIQSRSTKHCPPILLLFRHSTSHTSISPAYTQPELMGAAHALALMYLLTKVATGAHSARFLVMLNHSPHAGMLAHSELWPRFSGTAPWWTCRTTRRSASL